LRQSAELNFAPEAVESNIATTYFILVVEKWGVRNMLNNGKNEFAWLHGFSS
jgi:hypothetical protein